MAAFERKADITKYFPELTAFDCVSKIWPTKKANLTKVRDAKLRVLDSSATHSITPRRTQDRRAAVKLSISYGRSSNETDHQHLYWCDYSGRTSAAATAEDSTIVVWPGNVNGWSYANFGTDASQAFVNGPDVPPLGMGSASFTHEPPAGWNGGALHSTNFNGIYLRDITDLRYSAYQQGEPALLNQPPYVVLFLDLDDDGFVDDGIVFEPAWQSGGRPMLAGLQETTFTAPNLNVEQNGIGSTGAGVAANQWWEWDLLIGSWWGRGGQLSTGTNKLGVYECYRDGCVTIEALVEVYPDARIISQAGVNGTGGVRLQYGFGGNSHEYIGHVDALIIGLTTGDTISYDFELGPANKAACKKGGWMGFFRNQGQCVSYFVSNRPE